MVTLTYISPHITLDNNKNQHNVFCDRLEKLEQVSSFCRPVHPHTFTQADPSSSHWSKPVNQISVVPTCLDLNQQTHAVDFSGWIQRHTPSPLSLYRSAVCRCAAVCNRFFSAALQPEASTGLSGRKSITAGLSLACGGAYGREIRT